MPAAADLNISSLSADDNGSTDQITYVEPFFAQTTDLSCPDEVMLISLHGVVLSHPLPATSGGLNSTEGLTCPVSLYPITSLSTTAHLYAESLL